MMKKYPIGLYPIIDNIRWLEILLPLGIKHIQLRIKNKSEYELISEIQASIKLAEQYQAKLYINDYWELGIKYGAYGVHLGQEDLDTADITQILNSGLCLGVSAYTEQELSRAIEIKPSYIACGPVFPTQSKVLDIPALGTQKLSEWRKRINCPMVAIGGISQENIKAVWEAGVDGVSVISAITKAPNPEVAAKELIEKIDFILND